MISLIGVYSVNGEPNVALLELVVHAKHTEFDIGEITQAQNGIDPLEWQSPWDEKYLNPQGTAIIGDELEAPKEVSETTRIAFFMHFLDVKQPLLTPFGEVMLAGLASMPARLSSIMKYEQPY